MRTPGPVCLLFVKIFTMHTIQKVFIKIFYLLKPVDVTLNFKGERSFKRNQNGKQGKLYVFSLRAKPNPYGTNAPMVLKARLEKAVARLQDCF